jgi:hypothetical protein
MGKIIQFWIDNFVKHYKIISATITEVVITGVIILAYGLRSGMHFSDILFAIWISIQAALFLLMRLIGKGEVAEAVEKLNEANKRNDQLIEKAGYDRVIASYAIQMAAIKGQVPESIIGNERWINANELIGKTEIKMEEAIDEMIEDINKEEATEESKTI